MFNNMPLTEEQKDELIKIRFKQLTEAKIKIADLEAKLALTEKALELACEELGKVEVFDKEFMECESFYDYFKIKAKEMMKSE